MKNDQNAPLWMISLTDLFGLLLCFMIMAYSLLQVPHAQRADVTRALRLNFGKDEVAPVATMPLGRNAKSSIYWETWLKSRLASVDALASTVQVSSDDEAVYLTTPQALWNSPAMISELAQLVEVMNQPIVITIQVPRNFDTTSWGQSANEAIQAQQQMKDAGVTKPVLIALEPDDLPEKQNKLILKIGGEADV